MTRRVAAILCAGHLFAAAAAGGCSSGMRALDTVTTAPAEGGRTRILAALSDHARRDADGFLRDMQALHGLRGSGPFRLRSIDLTFVVLELPEDADPETALARLLADPRVASAQTVNTFRTRAEEEDDEPQDTPEPPPPPGDAPADASQPFVGDRYKHLQKGYKAVRAELAHRWATGKGVRVALVDTPILLTHPDLKGQVAAQRLFVPESTDPFSMRHGTAMAGVIAARRNDTGIVGVAPAARLLALGACRQAQPGSAAGVCDTVTLSMALDAAIAQRADVIVLSLSGPDDPLLARLVAAALDRGSVVVAASNWRDPAGQGFPSLPGVLAAQEPAPPGSIVPPWEPDEAPVGCPTNGILTTVPPGIWDYLKGDSLAAAHAAGVAALVKERAPKMTPAEIGLLLRSTAQPRLGLAPEMGTGIIDACSAVARLAGATCPP